MKLSFFVVSQKNFFASLSLLTENKIHNARLVTYLRPNEDYSPGNSLSDSSERLHKRGSGVSICTILVKEGIHVIKHTLWQKVATSHKKVAASHMEQFSLMILVFF